MTISSQPTKTTRTWDKILRALFWCHRIPERSFFFRGKQFPLCARCTGIAVGYILGIASLVIWRKMPLWAIAICILPMIIDGLLQNIWHIMSTNPRRFITGIVFGIAELHALLWIELGLFWATWKLIFVLKSWL
ncbi:MAG: DUF2085 domain-containing protein [Oscillospiraceae bacterium]|jgi:uncharacterized membrane protein|nr:DUF2085 domain-containing protein [Oscillospiraceae bacterium]